MNSGLYACAGASATASAAACAKRFDEPITKRSNVYFVFRPDSLIRCAGGCVDVGDACARLGDGQLDPALLAGCIADCRADQLEEVPLDPLACEVVRDGEDERVVRDLRPLDLAEPRPVGGVVERPFEAPCYLGPEGLCSQLNRLLHPAGPSSSSTTARAEHSNVPAALQWLIRTEAPIATKQRICRDFSGFPHDSPQVWTTRIERVTAGPEKHPLCSRLSVARVVHIRGVEKSLGNWQRFGDEPAGPVARCSSILTRSAAHGRRFRVQRTLVKRTYQPNVRRRKRKHGFPGAHVHPRRPGDPEAPPREGPEAAVRLTRPGTSCSAGTDSPARGTSTPSTARVARSRRGFSFSTGSPVTTTASRGSASPCRRARGAPWSATA